MPSPTSELKVEVHSKEGEDGFAVSVWQARPRGWTFYHYAGHSARWAAMAAVARTAKSLALRVPDGIAKRLTTPRPKCECCQQELPDA